MHPLKFQTLNNADIYEYHFHPKGDSYIIGHDECFLNNPRLQEDWMNQEGIWQGFLKYKITNSATVENSLLYMLLIKELAQDTPLLGTLLYDSAFVRSTKAPIPINWGYKLIHQSIIINQYERIDIGFIDDINRDSFSTTLFQLHTFQDLADTIAIAIDATTSYNYYITHQPEALITQLNTSEKPELSQLLQMQDILIALVVGEDPGYFDYLVIKSKQNISSILDTIANKINAFATDYIRDIKTVNTLDQMLTLIEDNLVKHQFQYCIDK